ncbi:MAG: type II toxin-antitoxin system PemK/MazF family toxin [Syntrophobacteraceae bacterium]
MINQGDIYWIDVSAPSGSGPALLHPHVAIQNNVFNRSHIRTAVVCALTSNLKRASAPGNILLEPGEANLPRQSVVNVSRIFTVDKADLGEYIETLSKKRIHEILDEHGGRCYSRSILVLCSVLFHFSACTRYAGGRHARIAGNPPPRKAPIPSGPSWLSPP